MQQHVLFQRKQEPELTILSFGAGQDSTAILLRLIHDPDFRRKYAPNELMVTMADTGCEHPETYQHVRDCERICRENGITFTLITNSMGFHNKSWPSLEGHFERNRVVFSKAGFKKSCTHQLKIAPFYKWLDHMLGERYGWKSGDGKPAIQRFHYKHGRIHVLLGIAADEDRVDDSPDKDAWMNDCVRKVYPLRDLGWTRKECQDYIRQHMPVPLPSNCMFCHFMDLRELLWLHRFYPERFKQWVEYEAAKLDKFRHLGDKNMGVFGSRTLTESLAEAERKHGHMTSEELHEWKMSHGHCVKTRY